MTESSTGTNNISASATDPDTSSRLARLSALEQSVWIDFLSRESTRGGHLQRLIDEDTVVGATTNPTIFETAMSEGSAYDEELRALAGKTDNAKEIFWDLAERDVAEACDVFHAVWERTRGRDGYVSIEVDPGLAYETAASYRQAIRLHESIDKPNLLVKIPGTEQGLQAIEDAIAKGRSINVTLIFSLARYAEVAEAYVRGLERLIGEGGEASRVTSVASFFVSRIDTETDKRLDAIGGHDELKGRLAVENAKLAYQHYKETFRGPRWEALAANGAKPQRVLWASTSTKNPAYPDTLYVDELIGPDTVNTMPEKTLLAFRDHGSPEPRLDSGLEHARALFDQLERVGVDYDDVTQALEREGVEKFIASYSQAVESLREKLASPAAA